jgi:hypothetical protein
VHAVGRLTVGVVKETAPGERRVALVPGVVGRLRAAGVRVAVEAGAGAAAWFPDEAYAAQDAVVLPTADLYAEADVLLSVGRLDQAGTARLRAGQTLIGLLAPLTDPGYARRLADLGVTAVSLDRPRGGPDRRDPGRRGDNPRRRGDPPHHRAAAGRRSRLRRRPMTGALLSDLTIFVLSLLVGFEVISKVPATLHTPLMSAANSIHGIGQPVQRGRRRRGGIGRGRRLRAGRGRRPRRRPAGADHGHRRPGRRDRLGHPVRFADRLGQAAGPDQQRAGGLPGRPPARQRDLRHADPGRGQGPQRHRHQALALRRSRRSGHARSRR